MCCSSWNIRTMMINLQCAGDTPAAGRHDQAPLHLRPAVFMANDIYYYNFAWADYGEASLGRLLDMAKVLAFALQRGRMASLPRRISVSPSIFNKHPPTIFLYSHVGLMRGAEAAYDRGRGHRRDDHDHDRCLNNLS
ncbi:Protein tyrosine phosphatase domain-containing protein 1 [Eumeta japonica]|uniref:Protein tyrosine phosphatase domain-containing protein 1 n=1 Tax=Eumeta variegata TaxID=151549 RepID=A0A4C1WWE3_EUMVA|nr:Protein tyrosine phosphatase domain-containing protein 1 [Eumeta japonica]